VHDRTEVGELGNGISELKWKMVGAISSDPAAHVRKIRAVKELGASAVVLMNVSDAYPQSAPKTYGAEVLPALRS
jgi:coenzyme F420-dependent glucose-6-phosphate dehydrogenase